MNLHIHAPPGKYIGQIRRVGCRTWRTVTRDHASAESAMSSTLDYMKYNDKRARVLFCDDSGYYEPNLVMELKRT